jgi:hypothetical protein
MRPTGVPTCFTPLKQQLPGPEASVGDIVVIVRKGDDPVGIHPYLPVVKCVAGRASFVLC